jgi:hypothetical protein
MHCLKTFNSLCDRASYQLRQYPESPQRLGTICRQFGPSQFHLLGWSTFLALSSIAGSAQLAGFCAGIILRLSDQLGIYPEEDSKFVSKLLALRGVLSVNGGSGSYG